MFSACVHSAFSYAILLWQVMDSEFMLHASHVLVPCEVIREKFSPSIGVCHFDAISSLHLDECFIALVGIDGLAFLCLEIEHGFTGYIIYACCHIQVSAEALD